MNYTDCIVIIPCFNEEASITLTINQVKEFIPGSQIYVVDNCSTDSTAQLASAAGAISLFEPKQGKGFAVRRAFREIKDLNFKVVLMIDGDATYSVENFLSAYEKVCLENYDMVVGNRVGTGSFQTERKAPYRRFHLLGNILLTALNNLLFKVKIEDTLSGWRAFSPGFIRSFAGGATGFEIESELNIHAHTLSCAVCNIDVEYFGRLQNSESKLNTIRDGLKILRRQMRLFRSERPVVAYSILSGPWFLVSMFLMNRVASEYLSTGLVLNFPSLIAGVAAFIISSLLWTTGMILQNVRLSRVQIAHHEYSKSALDKTTPLK